MKYLILSFIAIITYIIVCLVQYDNDEMLDLGSEYKYCEDGQCLIIPGLKNRTYNPDGITVVSISYDDQYILAMEMIANTHYRYWAIDKINDTIYAPFVDYEMFEKNLQQLRIPIRIKDPTTYKIDGQTHCIISHTIDESIKYINK